MPVPQPVQSDEAFPERCAVAIIGGGIIGAATALELSERGIPVALFEKGEIGCEQSSRNWGWVRKMGRDIRELPLMIESARLWAELDKRIGAATGFTQCGILYLARTEADLGVRERWLDRAKGLNHGSRLLGAKEVKDRLPDLQGSFAGALFTADDARAEPQWVASAITESARAKGATIFTRCAVRGIETSAGRISGIVTERGRVACESVVVAGGAWSRRFLGNIDIEFPQLSVVNSALRTTPMSGPNHSASGVDFAFRKRADGGYTIAHNTINLADLTPDHFRLMRPFFPALVEDWPTIKIRIGRRFLDEASLARKWRLDEVSPFEQVRILDPAPVDFVLDTAVASIKRHMPVFSGMIEAERWAGIIDSMPDVVPVIDNVARIPGLVIASGFSGHGFGIGPGAGRLAAALVTGETPFIDITPFRLDRFGRCAG